jgi:hypothetical protein
MRRYAIWLSFSFMSWRRSPASLVLEESVLLSHPFVERLIGTIRRECLDRTLFWTSADLENKLLDFRRYFNDHRSHAALEGRTSDKDAPMPPPVAHLPSWRWQRHCRSRPLSGTDRVLISPRLFLPVVCSELSKATHPETIRCLSL